MTTTAKCACAPTIRHERYGKAECTARMTALALCPLHAAAEDMREALRDTLHTIEASLHELRAERSVRDELKTIRAARAALQKAEEKT